MTGTYSDDYDTAPAYAIYRTRATVDLALAAVHMDRRDLNAALTAGIAPERERRVSERLDMLIDDIGRWRDEIYDVIDTPWYGRGADIEHGTRIVPE